MSRHSSLRFVPSVESFDERVNPAVVGTHALYQDLTVPTLASGRPTTDYSAIVFVGGWGSSMAPGDSYYGRGILRSQDAGATWSAAIPNTNETMTIGVNRTETVATPSKGV